MQGLRASGWGTVVLGCVLVSGCNRPPPVEDAVALADRTPLPVKVLSADKPEAAMAGAKTSSGGKPEEEARGVAFVVSAASVQRNARASEEFPGPWIAAPHGVELRLPETFWEEVRETEIGGDRGARSGSRRVASLWRDPPEAASRAPRAVSTPGLATVGEVPRPASRSRLAPVIPEPRPAATARFVPVAAGPGAGWSAGLRFVGCEAGISARPPGYFGPDVPARGGRIGALTVGRFDTWWGAAHLGAIDYASLAALNGLRLEDIAVGRGLRRGTNVWVVVRSGPERRGRFSFCAPTPERIAAHPHLRTWGEAVAEAPGGRDWWIWPHATPWRAPAVAMVDAVPALEDPGAYWIPDVQGRTWRSAAAVALRVPTNTVRASDLAELWRYNGVRAGAVTPEGLVRGHIAVPAERIGRYLPRV